MIKVICSYNLRQKYSIFNHTQAIENKYSFIFKLHDYLVAMCKND